MSVSKYLTVENLNTFSIVLSNTKIIEIFFLVDEFCIRASHQKSPCKRKPGMSCREMITIMVLFYSGVCRSFTNFLANLTAYSLFLKKTCYQV